MDKFYYGFNMVGVGEEVYGLDLGGAVAFFQEILGVAGEG